MYTLAFIFLLFFVANVKSSQYPEGWVDPHDFSTIKEHAEGWTDPHDMSPTKQYLKYLEDKDEFNNYKNKFEKQSKCDCSSEKAINSKAEAYFKRTINMILNAVKEESFSDEKFSGYLFFKVDLDKYKLLQNFANNVKNKVDYRDVDGALTEILTKTKQQEFREYFESWAQKLFTILMTKTGIGCILLLSYCFAVYKLFFAKFNFGYILKFLFINFLIINFVFTWIYLYKTAEIDKMANQKKYENVPVYCDPSKMSSFQVMWNAFSSEDHCKKYHHIMHTDSFWTITPGIVLSEMFSQSIKSPVLAIATATADICTTLFYAFPWPLNIIIFPILLIFFIFLSCVVLSFVFCVPIKFNLFHLISTSFGHQYQQTKTDAISGKNLEKLLQLASGNQNIRNFIENVVNVNDNDEQDVESNKLNVNTLAAIDSGKVKKKNQVECLKIREKSVENVEDNVNTSLENNKKSSEPSSDELMKKHIQNADKILKQKRTRCECGSGDN